MKKLSLLLFLFIPILSFAQGEYAGPTTARNSAQAQESEMKINKLLDDSKTGKAPFNVTGSVFSSGTTESLTFTPITTGTTTIAAGTYSVQLLPSTDAAGSIISTGTFTINGATDALIPIIPARPGDTNPAITVTLTSGTLRRIQRNIP